MKRLELIPSLGEYNSQLDKSDYLLIRAFHLSDVLSSLGYEFRKKRLDARGFILGPPIALALKKPFIMMRKPGKMPNSVSSKEYNTEYGKRSGLTVQNDKVKKGDRVLIIDDLVATGGTLSSAIELVHMLGGTGEFYFHNYYKIDLGLFLKITKNTSSIAIDMKNH